MQLKLSSRRCSSAFFSGVPQSCFLVVWNYRLIFSLGVPLKGGVFRCISLREDAAATAHALWMKV